MSALDRIYVVPFMFQSTVVFWQAMQDTLRLWVSWAAMRRDRLREALREPISLVSRILTMFDFAAVLPAGTPSHGLI